MSRGNLHPINGRRRQRSWLKTGLVLQRRTGYHPSSREWGPRNYWSKQFGGWTFPEVKEKVLGLFGKKFLVILLVALVSSGIFVGVFQDKLFHSIERNPLYPGDPFSYIWEFKGERGDLGNWNSLLASYRTTCVNNIFTQCIALTANTTNAAEVLTTIPIDLSTVSSKELGLVNKFIFASNTAAANTFEMFLTRNGTLPLTAGYNPTADRNVALVIQSTRATSTTFTWTIFVQKDPSTSIQNQIGAGFTACETGTACLGTGTSTYQFGNSFSATLNFTGSTDAGANGGSRQIMGNAGGSTIFTTLIPQLQFQGVSYFFGLYEQASNPAPPEVDFETGNSANPNACLIAVNVGTAMTDCMALEMQIPIANTPVPPAATTDTGGWFGSAARFLGGAWNAFTGAASATFNAIAQNPITQGILGALEQAFLWVGQQLINGLNLLEGLIKIALNAVGVAFGFPASPGLGDNIFTFINSVITLFTTQVPNAFGQIVNIFNGWINTLVIIFTTGVVGQIFTFLSSVLTFGVNIVAFAFGVFTTGLNWTTIFVPFWLMIWFFGYNADEGMNGWIRWFEFVKWLAFDIGVKNVTWVINWVIDIITAALAILPKPFINMAGKFPRIPIIDIHGTFSVPDFDGQYLKEGNLFSVLGMLGGFMGFVWYELTQTGIPGTLANEYPTQAWVTTASTAITFYKLFLPMAVLVVFLLMVPTLFTSIFGVRALGIPSMPVSVSTRRRSVVVHGRSGGGKLIRASQPGRRTQAFITSRLAKIESREKKGLEMRNKREQQIKELAEKIRKEAESKQKEQVKTQVERQREQSETEA